MAKRDIVPMKPAIFKLPIEIMVVLKRMGRRKAQFVRDAIREKLSRG